jgi:ATP-dependent Clp protease ATP-binding subunit ClpA
LGSDEVTALFTELKNFVTSLPKDCSLLTYAKYVISKILHDANVLADYSNSEDFDKILHLVYDCIVDIYPYFSIENICSDLNGSIDILASLKQLDSLKQEPPILDIQSEIDDILFDASIISSSAVAAEPARETKKKNQKPYSRLTVKELSSIEEELKKNIVGQDEAIKVLIDRLKLISVGFEKRANLFFIGRTGTGKTELAKVFAKKYCGNFYKINCAEFSNGHEVAKLVGAPPGYVGSGSKSIFLEKAEKSSCWVFLFDEIEKANEKLFNLLLSLLDDGTIVDSQGKTLDFKDSIFIFTSNQGVSEIKDHALGFGGGNVSYDSSRETLKNSLGNLFTPEFRNRIDEFVYFNDLTKQDVERIVKLNLKQYPVNPTQQLIDFVVEKAYSVEYGVRELKRFLRSNVALPIADNILLQMSPIDGSGRYTMSVRNSKLEVVNVKPPTKKIATL